MKRLRPGLSRLEFLIAAVMAAILAALLIPAIQKLRVASQRAQCIGNLQKIGFAVQSYHTTKRRLPPGGSHTPPATSACLATPDCREREWSWAYHILPHLGHEDTYQNPDSKVVLATRIPSYFCPARRKPRCYNNRAMIDYAANAGTRPGGANGAIVRTSAGPISITDITDGAASTVLIAEKRSNISEFGNNPGDIEGFAVAGWTEGFEIHRLGDAPPTEDLESPGDLSAFSEFGSSHPGVINATFVDGSVRTIRFTVNPAIWRRACIRNDNESFSLNEL